MHGIRQAFAEFLWLPASVIIAFLVLAVVTFYLDRSEPPWLAPLRALVRAQVFADSHATGELLRTISSGLITITSITISLLLIALQQSASALTHQVYDQFLRSRHNQFYFGFFVGLSLYTLVTLASVGPLNPVIGGFVALLGTVMALCLLLVLFYTTVNQMRPQVIIEAIHDHALSSRKFHIELLHKMRRTPRLAASVRLTAHADAHGFVTRIDVTSLGKAIEAARAEVEVVLRVAIGTHVVFGQALADVVAHSREDAQIVADALEDAIQRSDQRDLAHDPLDAVAELETIGWTSISTAQSDADAGRLTILALRDILARWSVEPEVSADADALPIVYADDALEKVLAAFESLAVAASESMQHQNLAEVLRTFAMLYRRMSPACQRRTEDIVLRTLSGLGEHVLTLDLEDALARLGGVLNGMGRVAVSSAVHAAQQQLAASIGKLGSRATRGQRPPESPLS
jgi:hypothetical protein